MQFPFTVGEFLNVFKSYNEKIFPVQILFYFIAFYCIYLIFKRNKNVNKIISIVLSFFWIWIGIVYQLIYFSSINSAAYAFGVLFLVQGSLFAYYGILKGSLSFSYERNALNIIGIIFLLYALIVYPVLNYLLGHPYPYAPTFGLPCPTTIFTFGILLFSDKKISVILLIIPLIWSIIGFGAALNLSIYEDFGLIISGLSGFILLLFFNKKFSAAREIL